MLFNLVQSNDYDCIFVRSSGLFRAADMLQLYRVVGDLELYIRGVPLVHDMRLVDFDVDENEVMFAGEITPPRVGNLAHKLALISDCPKGYLKLRTLAARRERTTFEAMPFLSVTAALEWLDLPTSGDRFPPEIEHLIQDDLHQAQSTSDSFRFVLSKQGPALSNPRFHEHVNPAYPAAAT